MDSALPGRYVSGMTDAPHTWDVDLDAAGLLCPLPVLRARKRLITMTEGQVLRLLATDPAAIVDIPHFCAGAGHSLIGVAQEGPTHAYFIRRGR